MERNGLRERRALATSRAGDSLVGGRSRGHRELFGERALRSIHTAKPPQMEPELRQRRAIATPSSEPASSAWNATAAWVAPARVLAAAASGGRRTGV